MMALYLLHVSVPVLRIISSCLVWMVLDCVRLCVTTPNSDIGEDDSLTLSEEMFLCS